MKKQSTHEFFIERMLVRVYASYVSLPGVAGWVGAWAIYDTIREMPSEPVRIGDTDIEESEEIALGTAKAIACAIAVTL